MLSPDEEKFLTYWAVQRTKKRQYLNKFSLGLPLGVFVFLAILINLLSGWYDKAEMVMRANSSVIIVIMIAGLAIVVFITIFSARHRWEQNELRFQELMARKELEAEENN